MIYPGFKTHAILHLAMHDFDHNYENAVDLIQDKLITFNEKGSGWALKNVHNIFISIVVYEPTLFNPQYSEDMLYH